MQATENLKVIIMLRASDLVVIVGGNYPEEMNDQINPIVVVIELQETIFIGHLALRCSEVCVCVLAMSSCFLLGAALGFRI